MSLSARLPANLDATEWELLLEVLGAIKQALPNANAHAPGEVMRHVLRALQLANAPTIVRGENRERLLSDERSNHQYIQAKSMA